ncbi:DUF2608 domain-containing protein [Paraglaciecola aquimarina]|uniref:DUF2608 domain-containing protein n=1 Tax=Paraglaciecola aquimarina TaxID=1235557 RepID=A0ABU3T262_9ALTE|nr:DUF2608 domain-containing protein [Paraglaciecola aquimarina]MDU0356292.1 DUF2608 domain-containing protein [Paraglaciecola aquimarina]
MQFRPTFHGAIIALSTGLLLTACASDTATSRAHLLKSESAPLSVVYQTKELQDAADKAKSLDKDSTLVVFDIDDTLLTATEFFGSDKWYDWQRGRALNQAGDLVNIATSDKVNCLFDVLGMVFEIAVNRPTQPNMADIVAGVNNDVVILTARSGAYRAATMRELARNQLNFADNSLAPTDMGYHYDYTLGGRTAQVSYVNGVFMVQGLNKGVLLLDLLKRSGKQYKSVVFVDDKKHNIDNMANALKSANINYYGFHYTRISKAVSEHEVAQAKAANIGLNALLDAHFVDRSTHLSQRQCDY